MISGLFHSLMNRIRVCHISYLKESVSTGSRKNEKVTEVMLLVVTGKKSIRSNAVTVCACAKVQALLLHEPYTHLFSNSWNKKC